MSRKSGRKKAFSRLDIALIAIVSLIGLAAFAIAVVMIWLPAAA